MSGEDAVGRREEAVTVSESDIVEFAADEDGRPLPGTLQAVDAKAIDLDAVVAIDEQEDIALVDAKAGQLAGEAFLAGDRVAGEFLAGFGVEEEDGVVVGDEEAIIRRDYVGGYRAMAFACTILARLPRSESRINMRPLDSWEREYDPEAHWVGMTRWNSRGATSTEYQSQRKAFRLTRHRSTRNDTNSACHGQSWKIGGSLRAMDARR